MERTHIKNSFVGFAHRVAPLQNIFHKECSDADLNTDVLEFLSCLQNELIGKMIDAACAISQHRRSKDVAAEDLLCHLDTQWNLDPLLMTANCIKTCYRVTETADEIDLSLSPDPLPRNRKTVRSRNLPKVHSSSSKVKKNSAEKSKLKSKCDQSIKIVHNKSKVNSKSQDMCCEHPLKTHLPLSNKKPEPELKAKKADSFIEFLGNKHKLDICNIDVVPEPSAVVPIYKPKSKSEEKISICKSPIKVSPCKGKSELEFQVPVWFHLDPDAHTYRRAGLKQDVSVADTVPKSIEAPMGKSKVEKQSSTCECPIKVLPFKEKTEPKSKVPTTFCCDSETRSFRIAGLRHDASVADATSKQSPETPTCKPKSKAMKKIMICENSVKVLPFKDKAEPESKVPTQIPFDTERHTLRITETKKDFFKQSSKACLYKPKSNIEKRILSHEHSTEVSSLKEKIEPGFKFAKQASIEMPHPDSHVHKISLKRRKREVFGINDVPVETPEEARKRLAIILLRIAGRY